MFTEIVGTLLDYAAPVLLCAALMAGAIVLTIWSDSDLYCVDAA
jgi:hypothetical protein